MKVILRPHSNRWQILVVTQYVWISNFTDNTLYRVTYYGKWIKTVVMVNYNVPVTTCVGVLGSIDQKAAKRWWLYKSCLFHVLYKDINNDQNYKICVLEDQAYVQVLVCREVTINCPLNNLFSLIFFKLVPCFQCDVLLVSLHYIWGMNWQNIYLQEDCFFILV